MIFVITTDIISMSNPLEFPLASEKESVAKREAETPQEIFRRAGLARVDELVRDGTYPQQYADERREAIMRIETGFTNPEQDGRALAEVGAEAIKAFRDKVASAETQVVQMVGDALLQVDDMWQQFQQRKIVPINLKELTTAVESTKLRLQDDLAAFQAKVQEVKDLQVGLSALARFDDFEGPLHELKELLDDVRG
jgi:hypothetical protein